MANRRPAPLFQPWMPRGLRAGHTAWSRLSHEARGSSVLLRIGPEMQGPWTWARCSPASWRRRGAVAMPLTAKQVVRGSKPAARWWWTSPRGWAPGMVGVRAGVQAAWCVGCLCAASPGASDPRHHSTVANARFEEAARPPSPFGLSLGGTCGRWASSRAPGHRQGTQRSHCHLLAARPSLVWRPWPPGALPPTMACAC